MKRLLLSLACAALLTGCWAHAIGVMTFTVIPSIVSGAEMRAARAHAENVGP